MSDVDTLTLAEFLLARIAEDEARARAAGEPSAEWWGPNGKVPGRVVTPHGYAAELARDEGAPDDGVALIERFGPARVLAECEAKRELIALHRRNRYQPTQCVTCGWVENWEVRENGPTYPCDVLKTLGAIYADHPDYRADWDEEWDDLPPRQPAH